MGVALSKSKNLKDEYTNILLLGNRAMGKSTVFNAMQLIHGWRPNETDWYPGLQHIKQQMREYCVSFIIYLFKKSQRLYSKDNIKYNKCYIDMNDEEIASYFLMILNHSNSSISFDDNVTDFDRISKLGQNIKKIWNLKAIQETFNLTLKQKTNIQYETENIDYFLNKITQIMSKKWIVTEEDLLKIKILPSNTLGLYQYTLNGKKISVFDGPYQIDNVKCIVFIIGLIDFCKPSVYESIELFKRAIHNKRFRKSKMVLLLNKMDLFKQYLKIKPLSACFNDYKGRNYMDINAQLTIYKLVSYLLQIESNMDIPLDIINIISIYFDINEEWLNFCVNDGIQFFKQKFLSLHTNPNQTLHIFQASAVETEQIQNVMNKIHHIINI